MARAAQRTVAERLDRPELFAPLPVAALALLAANDHVFKARFPGFVTGKLSDVAGCFFLPLFVAALIGIATRLHLGARLATGAAATALLMAALKLSPAGAALAGEALTAAGRPLGLFPSRVACDPTDLLALPFAALAVAYGLRAGARRGAP